MAFLGFGLLRTTRQTSVPGCVGPIRNVTHPNRTCRRHRFSFLRRRVKLNADPTERSPCREQDHVCLSPLSPHLFWKPIIDEKNAKQTGPHNIAVNPAALSHGSFPPTSDLYFINMGKRSKRGRTNASAAGAGAADPSPSTKVPVESKSSSSNADAETSRESRRPRTAADPTARRKDKEEEEEGPDNLRFEDPFPDEYEEEDVADEDWSDADDDVEDDEDLVGAEASNKSSSKNNKSGMEDAVQAWNPFSTADDGSQGQQQPNANVKLEMDPTAYKLHHALTPEWPSLSLDFVRDHLGVRSNTKFPHSILCAVGTQADRPADNRVTIMKLSDLGRIHAETEDDILGEEYDPNGGDDDDDDDSDDDDNDSRDAVDEADLDPVVEHYSIKHYGGVNRIRSMPQNPNVVATWSDAGKVNLFHIQSILQRFDASAGVSTDSGAGGGTHNKAPPLDIPNKPHFSYAKHNTEGFALDWSPCEAGQLATGDCHGGIHLWNPRPDGTYAIAKAYDDASRKAGDKDDSHALLASSTSVEDLQWSPTERTVLASAECGGYVRIYDSRAPNRAMLSHQIHDNHSDVNVLSWNRLVSNLLATGSDDGVLSVWDLRHFAASSSSGASKPNPLARFTPHTTPITSVEWHPTDESMLVVTDDRGAYVYDLSVEEDDTIDAEDEDAATGPALPPQLLFVHCGSEQFKEAHWHPQIPSMIMTTALSGYSVFIPSNL
jgi:ribosome assembly protein RRB1